MQKTQRVLLTAIAGLSLAAMGNAQAPAGRRRSGRGRPRACRTGVFGHHGRLAGRRRNSHEIFRSRREQIARRSNFTGLWGQCGAPAPDTLQTYAVIFHDIENSTNKTTIDTLHWSAFNIPGTAKGLPEELGNGDLPDGTRNGPGIAQRGGNPPAYFGPGAGPGPIHHYVFEFYALDTKLDLPANTHA